MTTSLQAIAMIVFLAAATVARSAEMPGDDAGQEGQVVVLTKVRIPWYAPNFLVKSKFKDTVTQYESLPGLQYKYYAISEDNKYGGLYLWKNRALARAWFNEAWSANLLKTRGAPPEVTYFDAPVVLDNTASGSGVPGADGKAIATLVRITTPRGVSRTMLLSEFKKSISVYQAVPGLLRKYFIVTDDARFGGIYLWKNIDAAKTFYNADWHERVAKTYGVKADIEYFQTPLILPSKLTNQ